MEPIFRATVSNDLKIQDYGKPMNFPAHILYPCRDFNRLEINVIGISFGAFPGCTAGKLSGSRLVEVPHPTDLQ